MTATDISWRIETEAFGTIDSDALLDEVPEYRRGESRTYTFSFEPSVAPGDADDYRAARQFLDWAGANATGTAVNSVPWYREQLPPRADIDSTLVALVPSADLQDGNRVRGVWGVITGGEDGTLPSLTGYEVTFEVFVLAEYDEYADRAAVKSEFEA
jgi:hypothetical protein